MAFKPPMTAPSDNASGRGFSRHSPANATEPGITGGSGTRPVHRYGTSAKNSSQRPFSQHQPPGPTASTRKSKPALTAGRQADDSSAKNASGRKPGQLNR